jgi:hypothetical protein
LQRDPQTIFGDEARDRVTATGPADLMRATEIELGVDLTDDRMGDVVGYGRRLRRALPEQPEQITTAGVATHMGFRAGAQHRADRVLVISVAEREHAGQR